MPPVTVVSSILLIALGLWAYLTGTGDHVSITALIPAFVGLPLLVFGLLAFKDSIRKHAMHAAVLIGLLAFLGAAFMLGKGLLDPAVTGAVTFDTTADGWLGTKKLLVNGLMALISGVFVALCVRSFIVARIAQRKKQAEAAAS
jgi:hypothetical protein